MRWTFIILIMAFLILGNYSLSDIDNALNELGTDILPKYPLSGILIIIFIFLFITFTYEFLRFFDRIERGIKAKD